MSFSLDITTDVGKVRYLIGDVVAASATFTNEEITGFLAFVADQNFGVQSILLACAFACDAMASLLTRTMQAIKLGDYQNDDSSKVKAFKDQATRFRDLEYNTPAFAVVEENLSGFNELEIIRNYILRTEA